MANTDEVYMPLAGYLHDGWSNSDEATATCFCGAVQLAFPTSGPGLVNTFVCHCTDCRKITASMFASNFSVADASVRHVRGREKLTVWRQARTIASGNTMENHFCSGCGSLMYRISSGRPDIKILRIGTVDDFHLHETKLRPRVEQYTKDRVAWLADMEGMEHYEARGNLHW